MTEIEAIKEIEERVQITEHVGGSYVDCVDIEALRIAIFTLKQMEKAQLPGEDATSDCISRKGLKENLLSEDYETHDYCFPCKEIMKRIDEQPSVQSDHIADGGKKGDHLRDVTKKVDVISRQVVKDALADKSILEWEELKKCYPMLEVVDEVPPAQPEQRWIPCSERLPEDDVEVFVYLFERPAPYIAWVKDCRWYTEDFEVEKENYPTAWMPLPEPWKGDTQE